MSVTLLTLRLDTEGDSERGIQVVSLLNMLVCIYLLYYLLQAASGCMMLGNGDTVFLGSPGESVWLPCYCPDKRISTDVSWTYLKPHVNALSSQHKDFLAISTEEEPYRGRVSIHSENVSLHITNLKKEDQGSYWCKINNQTHVYISLEVKGCSLSQNKVTVPVSKSSGEAVLLDCSCADLQEKPERVVWTAPNNKHLTVTEHCPHYNGRVQMFNQNSTGNLSVLISDLTEEDGGLYSCWINRNQYKNFSLTVRGCKLSVTEDTIVSKYPGESVLLPCSCTDQNTRPKTFSWEHVDSSRTVIHQTAHYTGRVHMFNKKLAANLSLLISNLTEEDRGTYRCTINSKQAINITLSVIAQHTSGSFYKPLQEFKDIIIICIILLVLLTLIGAAAYAYRKYVKGRKKNSVDKTGHEQENEDDINIFYCSPRQKGEITEVPGSNFRSVENTVYSDLALVRMDKPEQQDEVTYAAVTVIKRGDRVHNVDHLTYLSAASKSQNHPEEATLYASVNINKKS